MNQTKHSFEEWLNNLPLQTLTDELKLGIIEEHNEHCEKTYSEQDVKLILYAFKNAFDKPCYTQQLNIDLSEIITYSTGQDFPWETFYEQCLKPTTNESNKNNSL